MQMPLCHYFHNGCELNIILRVLLFATPTLYLEFTLLLAFYNFGKLESVVKELRFA
jgi:hypothetical protein